MFLYSGGLILRGVFILRGGLILTQEWAYLRGGLITQEWADSLYMYSGVGLYSGVNILRYGAFTQGLAYAKVGFYSEVGLQWNPS